MLRTTDIDSGQPLLAEHSRYGATDLSTVLRVCDLIHKAGALNLLTS